MSLSAGSGGAVGVPRILLVSDRFLTGEDVAGAACRALAGVPEGMCGLWVREKDLPDADRWEVVAKVVAAVPAVAVVVGVDDVGSAQRRWPDGVAGVHCAQKAWLGGVPARKHRLGLWGGSWHGDMRQAPVAALDYVTLSPWWPSVSKPGHVPVLSRRCLMRACRSVNVPVLALGGVTPGRVGECLAAGAYGVALAGAVWSAPEPAEVVAQCVAAVRRSDALVASDVACPGAGGGVSSQEEW